MLFFYIFILTWLNLYLYKSSKSGFVDATDFNFISPIDIALYVSVFVIKRNFYTVETRIKKKIKSVLIG